LDPICTHNRQQFVHIYRAFQQGQFKELYTEQLPGFVAKGESLQPDVDYKDPFMASNSLLKLDSVVMQVFSGL